MADPFVAEIRIFAGNFAPRYWAKCDGQLLPINQNQALFALLGVNYGGDGRSNFALPDLKGRAPMHTGIGPGLSERRTGDAGGEETVTLDPSHIPQHTHAFGGLSSPGTAKTLQGNVLAGGSEDTYVTADIKIPVPMSAASIGATGGGMPHNNLQPYLVLTFIIALQGIFPQHP